MLHLRRIGLLDLNVTDGCGGNAGRSAGLVGESERRKRLRELLHAQDGIDPDNVIMSPARRVSAD